MANYYLLVNAAQVRSAAPVCKFTSKLTVIGKPVLSPRGEQK
jgi:hypothetical protein